MVGTSIRYGLGSLKVYLAGVPLDSLDEPCDPNQVALATTATAAPGEPSDRAEGSSARRAHPLAKRLDTQSVQIPRSQVPTSTINTP